MNTVTTITNNLLLPITYYYYTLHHLEGEALRSKFDNMNNKILRRTKLYDLRSKNFNLKKR